MSDLRGKTAIVIGGAGGVGEGVVAALLESGATVIATARTEERLAELSGNLGLAPDERGRLHGETLDGLAPDLDDRLAAIVSRHGGIDIAVVSIASWGDQGRVPVLSLTDAEWDSILASNLTVTFRLYRALVPLLGRDALLVQLNGMSAEIPFPGGGGRALTAAAVKSLTVTLAAELGDAGPRVYELILGMVRTRARQAAGIDDRGWLDGREVGAHIADLATGESPLAGTTLQYLVDRGIGPTASRPER